MSETKAGDNCSQQFIFIVMTDVEGSIIVNYLWLGYLIHTINGITLYHRELHVNHKKLKSD